MDKPEKQTAPSFQEVQMVDADIVRAIRDLHALGWGSKRISQELGIARNTVRRYLRGGPEAEIQVRPKARRLDQAARKLAAELYAGPADGNAAVVRDMLEHVQAVDEFGVSLRRSLCDRSRNREAAPAQMRLETRLRLDA